MNTISIPQTTLSLIAECPLIFHEASEALRYALDQTQDQDRRNRLSAFVNECSSFSSIHGMLIDPVTGLFVTTAARDTVIESIARIAGEAFGDTFPLLRYKALDLVVRLNDAAEQICLLDGELSQTSTPIVVH